MIPRRNRAVSLTRASPRASLNLAREKFRNCRRIAPAKDHTATRPGWRSTTTVDPLQNAFLWCLQADGGPRWAEVRRRQGRAKGRVYSVRAIPVASGSRLVPARCVWRRPSYGSVLNYSEALGGIPCRKEGGEGS